MITQEQIIETLRKIASPMSDTDIVSAKMVKEVNLCGSGALIVIEIDESLMKFKQGMEATIRDAIRRQDSEIDINISIRKKHVDADKQIGGIGKVKNIVAVASGKGGVGKSTITANMAVALRNMGYRVGLIDADIFGPSMPKMFDAEDEMPTAVNIDGKELVVPIERMGIKILSIGFFVRPSDAVAWRGPVASGALKQLINDADWGELDYLLFDMPPGTSDIQLTLVQTIPVTGAVIVTTPQDIALIDAIKGIDFFQKKEINVPIVGLVENMAWFTPEELPNNRYYIFGNGGGEKLCKQMSIPFLGHVPIVQSIREGGDLGRPVAANDEGSILRGIFDEITAKAVEQLEIRKQNLPPTHKVETK